MCVSPPPWADAASDPFCVDGAACDAGMRNEQAAQEDIEWLVFVPPAPGSSAQHCTPRAQQPVLQPGPRPEEQTPQINVQPPREQCQRHLAVIHTQKAKLQARGRRIMKQVHEVIEMLNAVEDGADEID